MSKPKLTIIAGCNGSGKSSFSYYIVKNTVIPFDFDKRRQEIYDAFTFDFELREEMAHNKTILEFENQVDETNYHIHPLAFAEKFKAANFEINLIYFCLQNTSIAKERVAIRVNNGGHFVSDTEIESRFYLGYKNLDATYSFYDNVQLFDTSTECEIPKEIAFLSSKKVIRKDKKSCQKLASFFPELSSVILN